MANSDERADLSCLNADLGLAEGDNSGRIRVRCALTNNSNRGFSALDLIVDSIRGNGPLDQLAK